MNKEWEKKLRIPAKEYIECINDQSEIDAKCRELFDLYNHVIGYEKIGHFIYNPSCEFKTYPDKVTIFDDIPISIPIPALDWGKYFAYDQDMVNSNDYIFVSDDRNKIESLGKPVNLWCIYTKFSNARRNLLSKSYIIKFDENGLTSYVMVFDDGLMNFNFVIAPFVKSDFDLVKMANDFAKFGNIFGWTKG